MVASSDADLDEIIKVGSLCSVMVPDTFLSSGISTVDVVAGDPVYHIDLGTLHDDKMIVAGSKSKIYCINKVNTTLFYDDLLELKWMVVPKCLSQIWSVFFIMAGTSATSSRVASGCMVLPRRK